MKRDEDGILHAELNHAIARMGHTDTLIVTDAGFPIPQDAWRIDLALTRGVPGLYDVLEAIHAELIPETVTYADAVPENNPAMDERLQELYGGTGTALETIPHEDVIAHGAEAKAIVRTGSYVPWGNVIIECGTDPKPFFDGDREVMPEAYEQRYEEMHGERP
ncbi:D-ribose pyranase [Natronolimnobius sp. AArcel1]|uniref:D-ribose pyranase n=1 Tax=Natronolimnobius sp. AArcel1 TaxID=1679093 RepID=UPI0013EC8356|nr:D-ribose pyranase [Natronolimnobius sp. AArcel1]NGM70483.1 D-ribose pyranase [Natronolimnobius sp. AArcel1]